MAGRRIVICGAGVIGASVAYFLTLRGARPLVVDRARPGAAASGKAAGFLALDWNVGTPLDGLARASFALHRGLAADFGEERLGYRPMETLMTAAAEEGDLSAYRRLPSPAWLDGNVAIHQVIGDPDSTAQVDPLRFTTTLVGEAVAQGAELVTGVVDGLAFEGPGGALTGVSVDGELRPAETAVLALGPWTSRAQRWLALPQVLGAKGASVVLAADAPAQAVFSEVIDGGRPRSIEIYPRAGGVVYVCGHPEGDPLPDDPDEILPSDGACEELHRLAGLHSSALRGAEVRARAACYRPVTLDGIPLIGPVPGAPGAFLATGHAVWGILNAPATGRMVAEMILDGESRSLDASSFAVSRLPAGRI